jgi:hypothetical protein
MSWNFYCHNISLRYDGLTYICDDFEAAIGEVYGGPEDVWAKCWRVGDKAGFLWPFSNGSVDQDVKMRALYFYTSSPNPGSSWDENQNNRYWSKSTLSTWSLWSQERQLGICGIPSYVGGVQEPTTGDIGIVPPTGMLNFPGNSYNACIVLTGWNGSASTQSQPLRHINQNFNVYRVGSVGAVVSNATASLYVSVGPNTSGGFHVVIGCGDDEGLSQSVIDIGSIVNKWIMIILNVEAGTSFGDPTPDYYRISAFATGKVVTSTGEITDFSVEGFRSGQVSQPGGGGPGVVTNITPSTNFGSAGGLVYGRPTYFYDAAANRNSAFMFLGYSNIVKTEEQMDRMAEGFLQMFPLAGVPSVLLSGMSATLGQGVPTVQVTSKIVSLSSQLITAGIGTVGFGGDINKNVNLSSQVMTMGQTPPTVSVTSKQVALTTQVMTLAQSPPTFGGVNKSFALSTQVMTLGQTPPTVNITSRRVTLASQVITAAQTSPTVAGVDKRVTLPTQVITAGRGALAPSIG